ncbi:hypothetical protein NKH91_04405 [Mesorhizobium sp. M0894]|uniref:hypothetical protein n=1 Tax=unclassified Mesorhizobium TaxID=325217 RepID=UPI003336FED5
MIWAVTGCVPNFEKGAVDEFPRPPNPTEIDEWFAFNVESTRHGRPGHGSAHSWARHVLRVAAVFFCGMVDQS